MSVHFLVMFVAPRCPEHCHCPKPQADLPQRHTRLRVTLCVHRIKSQVHKIKSHSLCPYSCVLIHDVRLEDDPGLTSLELWVNRTLEHNAQALTYGVNGLLNIHWRTRSIAPQVRPLSAVCLSSVGVIMVFILLASDFAPIRLSCTGPLLFA